VDIGETSTLPLILPQPFVDGEWHITCRAHLREQAPACGRRFVDRVVMWHRSDLARLPPLAAVFQTLGARAFFPSPFQVYWVCTEGTLLGLAWDVCVCGSCHVPFLCRITCRVEVRVQALRLRSVTLGRGVRCWIEPPAGTSRGGGWIRRPDQHRGRASRDGAVEDARHS